MALMNQGQAVAALHQKAIAGGSSTDIEYKDYYIDCGGGSTLSYTSKAIPWKRHTNGVTMVASDDCFNYWDMRGSKWEYVEHYGQLYCVTGGYASSGTPLRNSLTVTFGIDGGDLTSDKTGNKLLTYSGYPVVASIAIDGNDYMVSCGFAASLSAADCAAACGLTSKTPDITIRLKAEKAEV